VKLRYDEFNESFVLPKLCTVFGRERTCEVKVMDGWMFHRDGVVVVCYRRAKKDGRRRFALTRRGGVGDVFAWLEVPA
jgi:hypothetical protein